MDLSKAGGEAKPPQAPQKSAKKPPFQCLLSLSRAAGALTDVMYSLFLCRCIFGIAVCRILPVLLACSVVIHLHVAAGTLRMWVQLRIGFPDVCEMTNPAMQHCAKNR